MDNNQIFKTLLHLTGLSKNQDLVIEIFTLGGIDARPMKIRAWRTDIGKPRASRMPDEALAGFIKGLFEYRDQQAQRGVNVFNFMGNRIS